MAPSQRTTDPSPKGALRPFGLSRVAQRQPLGRILLSTGRWRASQVPRLLADGQVAVAGRIVTDPGLHVNPWKEAITVSGRPLAPLRPCRYVIFNKPYQVLSSFTDPEGRKTLAEYIPIPDIYAVGRLDYDSEGLLLLTDDGWLNHRLTHPRYEHPKTYLVQVERIPDEKALEALRQGVIIQGRRTRPAEVVRLTEDELPPLPDRPVPIRYRANVPTCWLRITLYEGMKRQIRHMTAAVGFPTLRLIRIAIGPLSLEGLAPGAWRFLTEEELAALARWIHEREAAHPPRQRRSPSKGRTRNRLTPS